MGPSFWHHVHQIKKFSKRNQISKRSYCLSWNVSISVWKTATLIWMAFSLDLESVTRTHTSDFTPRIRFSTVQALVYYKYIWALLTYIHTSNQEQKIVTGSRPRSGISTNAISKILFRLPDDFRSLRRFLWNESSFCWRKQYQSRTGLVQQTSSAQWYFRVRCCNRWRSSWTFSTR